MRDINAHALDYGTKFSWDVNSAYWSAGPLSAHESILLVNQLVLDGYAAALLYLPLEDPVRYEVLVRMKGA